MKLLKKVGAALVSLAMLATTAFTTAASAEDTEGYNVYCAKVDMGSDEAYLLSVQDVPEKWITYSAIIANIRFGNIEQQEWADNYVSLVVNGQNIISAVWNSDGADENALSATLTKNDDNVYGMEMIFSIDSKYMKEFSNYNYAAVILVADISGEGDWQYITPDVQSETVTYVVAPISWQDWTTPDIGENVEPTEEPVESTEPDETEELIISEEPVESIEPAETETPKVITPDEPETEAPEAPAQAAPAESAPAASTSNTNKGNPDTGVAVAVVPLLIAGAGTAVLTRKRK